MPAHPEKSSAPATAQNEVPAAPEVKGEGQPKGLSRFFKKSAKPTSSSEKAVSTPLSTDDEEPKKKIEKWSIGILNDKHTDEVPGSILLMSSEHKRNEPLGLRNAPARNSASSLPSPFPDATPRRSTHTTQSPGPGPTASRTASSHSLDRIRPGIMRMFSGHSVKSTKPVVIEKKKTPDGNIILEPQPDDSLNDPLNWPSWRRDIALLSLGFYCMVGGGMTPVLAAGFNDVAETYDVSVPSVALSTGFYMAGLGVGSVIASPTAILFGKRPVYLVGAIMLILSSVWCAASPSYTSLVVARVFQGIAISPVECLPSATIAEIFFLHERAYRLGIYTLLLLGGKNLIPLVSAAIIGSLGWRWVFWIVALVAGFCLGLLFFFVPETFWDRTPTRVYGKKKHHLGSLSHIFSPGKKSAVPSIKDEHREGHTDGPSSPKTDPIAQDITSSAIHQRRHKNVHHVGFVDQSDGPGEETHETTDEKQVNSQDFAAHTAAKQHSDSEHPQSIDAITYAAHHDEPEHTEPKSGVLKTSASNDHNSPYYMTKTTPFSDHPTAHNAHDPEASRPAILARSHSDIAPDDTTSTEAPDHDPDHDAHHSGTSTPASSLHFPTYTSHLQNAPPKKYLDTLKPWNGRLRKDNWLKVAIRPFILFAYPGILWSTLVYSLSVGWLIVLSESVAVIYRDAHTYNFSALQTGLVYLSPFLGGILGTAVAGRFSDVIVRYLSRKNGGIYEPEFRLVMGAPVLLATVVGLMGFGWSAEERDNFMVPTVFFGVISFGCTLGSTTAITFAVDSYRQYAGEALVTMNFSKNIFHGLVFSLFFPHWLESSGSKKVFLVIGGIQVACLLSTIPMYIYGKRARMWTVRKNMMERF